MTNTLHAEFHFAVRRRLIGFIAVIAVPMAFGEQNNPTTKTTDMTTNMQSPLSEKQLAIGPIAANAAIGDMSRLTTALNKGLDAGLTINELKEVLVQLYAYAGFPRALNALAECKRPAKSSSPPGLSP